MASLYEELTHAVAELSARGLVQASKWAAEQLVGLEEEVQAAGMAAAACAQPTAAPSDLAHPRFLLGKSHFQFKEYQRAAYVLQGVPGPHAQFLHLYSIYLAGETRKEHERVEKDGELGKPDSSVNADLDNLERALADAVAQGAAQPAGGGGGPDPFLLYLHGVVLLDKQRHAEARDALVRSLHAFPCNWSAWVALRPLCGSLPELEALQLPIHWVRDFFLASALLDLQQNQEALGRLQRLSHVFPHSVYMEVLVAQVHYNLQNYDEAQSLFEDILGKDPFRLEGMDVFSNILFVKEQFAALSQLAHRAVATDKYSPDTCCIVGNYYSLKGQHEKAVEYFRRALRLNSRYLAAWTLMGHEFMEMKNTAAAIEAYRRAVDLNPHDFRAWYGLGQAYELLKMPYYAVYYYRRATSLRPSDARMWVALGQCYMSEQVNLVEQAARCYRRAIEFNDPDGIAAHMLAKLYEGKRQFDAAEQLYRYNLARLDAAGLPLGSDAVDALLFLAARCKDTGRLSEAQGCCERLLDVGGPAKERAKALAREVHALLTAQQQAQQAQQAQQRHAQQQQQAQQQQFQFEPQFRQPGGGHGAAAARGGGGGMRDGFGSDDDGMEAATPEPAEGGPPVWAMQDMAAVGGGAGGASAGPGRGGAATPGQAQVVSSQQQHAAAAAAVAGVAQQLRVGEREAAQLLAQAGWDASRAVLDNLHLLD